MRVLLVPLGSSGDVNPFVGIGVAMRQRGHDVTVVTNAHFEPMVRQAGLDFAAQSSEQQFGETIGHPDMWDPHKGPALFLRFCVECLAETYERLASLHEPGRTVCAAAPQAFGARVAQEKLGLPLATLIPNPMLLRSVYVMPKSPLVRAPAWIGPWGNRIVYRLLNRRFDKVLAGPVNEFRGSLGLTPARHVWGSWRNSPQRIIGLWPDWLYGPQRDWPPQALVTGFIEYDGLPTAAVNDADWRRTVDALEGPPIVFTAGTAMAQAAGFFAAAAGACTRLGRPGVLLTQRPQQLPAPLPPTVVHVAYAPLTELLGQAAALVHHGGIGTAARALKAGIPQVIMPMAYDQHDNVHRLEKLGVAREIPRERFEPARVAEVLRALIESPGVAERCRLYASRLHNTDAVDRSCDCLESLLTG